MFSFQQPSPAKSDINAATLRAIRPGDPIAQGLRASDASYTWGVDEFDVVEQPNLFQRQAMR
ncbi:MAG: hypothetical protein P1U83_07490 [Roseovarius sp.]|nr:hypothetical protein [Roseovarius sp.]